MGEAASRDPGSNTRSLLERVEAGEAITITVNGQPLTIRAPIGRRPRWIGCEEFVRRVGPHQAGSEFERDLTELAPDTTDDVRLP